MTKYGHEGFKLRAEKFIGYSGDLYMDTSKKAEAQLLLRVLEFTGLSGDKVVDFGFDYSGTAVYFYVEWELSN